MALCLDVQTLFVIGKLFDGSWNAFDEIEYVEKQTKQKTKQIKNGRTMKAHLLFKARVNDERHFTKRNKTLTQIGAQNLFVFRCSNGCKYLIGTPFL